MIVYVSQWTRRQRLSVHRMLYLELYPLQTQFEQHERMTSIQHFVITCKDYRNVTRPTGLKGYHNTIGSGD